MRIRRLLLGFGLKLAVFVFNNNLLAVGQPSRGGSVQFAVDVLRLDDLLAFIVPFDARAFALAVFESCLLLLLTVGMPGLPNAILGTGDIMLFGKWFLAGGVVLDPFAVAHTVLKAALC